MTAKLITATNAAVRAMHAAQQPVDPVKELVLAATIFADEFDRFPNDRDTLTACRNHVRAAIAALEAKS